MGTPINALNGLKWEPHDISKKFNGAYLKATLKAGGKVVGDRVLVKVRNGSFITTGENPHGDSVECHYPRNGIQNGEWTIGSFKYENFIVEEDRPDPCITNLDDNEAVLFCYNPDRQWQRGFHSGNSFIYNGDMSRRNVNMWGKDLAYRILYPEHTHLDEAVAHFRDNPKCTSRALNNLYWLVRKPGDGTYQLWRRRAFVGSLVGKRFFITPSAEILKEELIKELPILKNKYGYAS